eukprot:434524-Rhodomonas_salina.1
MAGDHIVPPHFHPSSSMMPISMLLNFLAFLQHVRPCVNSSVLKLVATLAERKASMVDVCTRRVLTCARWEVGSGDCEEVQRVPNRAGVRVGCVAGVLLFVETLGVGVDVDVGVGVGADAGAGAAGAGAGAGAGAAGDGDGGDDGDGVLAVVGVVR